MQPTAQRPAGELIQRILGIRIDNLTLPEALTELRSRLEAPSGPGAHVAFVNAHSLNVAARDAAYREALERADLVLPDGVGLRLAGRLLSRPIRDDVNGTDLFPRLAAALEEGCQRIFLLGGREGVAEGVERWLRGRHPGVRICGVAHGYFGADEEAGLVRRIRESRADLLMVALGVPRQELFIDRHRGELGVRVAMGVGGLFDFQSGRIPRAPRALRRLGLEWAYRLWQEPRRLARRYLLGNPLFLGRVFRERLRAR